MLCILIGFYENSKLKRIIHFKRTLALYRNKVALEIAYECIEHLIELHIK